MCDASCHKGVSHDAHFAIQACHAMIILPYTRIAWYRYAVSTDDTEAAELSVFPSSISMIQTHLQYCAQLVFSDLNVRGFDTS